MKLYYDLHLHSCLSPCGDEDMTPYNLVNMAKLMGLDIIALTDHNSCGNCKSAIEVGEKTGLTVVPGMEICTAEEIHCVCLFPDIEKAEKFSAYVKTLMPPIKNKEAIFGRQLFMDSRDNISGSEEILLTTACSISISDLDEIVSEYDGVCFPAHIDRSSYSVISSLGDFPAELSFTAFELTPKGDEKAFREKYSALYGKLLLRSSDAHYLQNMREAEFYIDLEENSPTALINYLRGNRNG